MMPVGGAFLGGVSERTPAGKTTLILQAVTEDNKNLSTAKWTISSTGRTYNVTADADGRAEQLVDSGFVYTITPTITGNYDGLTPQTVKADSTEAVLCQFDLRTPRALDSKAVHKNGEETIAGKKTFSVQPVIPATPESASDGDIATAGWVKKKISGISTVSKISLTYEKISPQDVTGYITSKIALNDVKLGDILVMQMIYKLKYKEESRTTTDSVSVSMPVLSFEPRYRIMNDKHIIYSDKDVNIYLTAPTSDSSGRFVLLLNTTGKYVLNFDITSDSYILRV